MPVVRILVVALNIDIETSTLRSTSWGLTTGVHAGGVRNLDDYTRAEPVQLEKCEACGFPPAATRSRNRPALETLQTARVQNGPHKGRRMATQVLPAAKRDPFDLRL